MINQNKDTSFNCHDEELATKRLAVVPWLVIIRGIPGSRKSTLARLIRKAKLFDNCISLDPDKIREEDLESFIRKYKLHYLNFDKKYRYNFKKAGKNLGIGKNVIWDQPFRTLFLLRKCIDRLKSFGVKFKLLIIESELNQKKAWAGVYERIEKGGHGPSKNVFDKMCEEYESADLDEFNVIKLDATKNSDLLIKEIRYFLDKTNMGHVNIYLVRHLATEYNKKGIYMGRLLDPPILEKEKSSFVETINRLNLTLANNSKVLFVSSPATRCLQTINILQDTLKINFPIQEAEELNETNYGLFAGKTPSEIKEKFSEIFKLWMEKPSKVIFPEGESYIKVQNRAYSKLLDLIENNQGTEKIFICTHVDVIKLILCKILSLPIKHRRLFRVGHGSFSCLQNISGTVEIKFLNFK